MALDTLKANRPLVLYGGLAGLVPFFISALGLQLGWLAVEAFMQYSVIILSFLSGALWWHGLKAETEESGSHRPHETTLPLALALPAAAWLVLFLPDRVTVLLLGGGYLALWVWEMLFMRDIYRKRYLLLRTVLTVLVLVLHFWVLTLVA